MNLRPDDSDPWSDPWPDLWLAFLPTGLVVLLALLLTPGPALFASGLALLLGLGHGVAVLRRAAARGPRLRLRRD